jgi:hypothetical protein
VSDRLRVARWVLRIQMELDAKQLEGVVGMTQALVTIEAPYATKQVLLTAYRQAVRLVDNGTMASVRAVDRHHHHEYFAQKGEWRNG